MSKSIRLGKKLGDMVSISAIDPDDPRYPDLYLSDVEDPAIADIPTDGECTIRYHVVSRTHREEEGKKRSCSIRMDILSITPPEREKKKGEYDGGLRKSLNGYFKNK